MPQLERLQKLEYEPGDHVITKLGREEWGDYAGFAKLSWDKVLAAHRHFTNDVRAGLWALL